MSAGLDDPAPTGLERHQTAPERRPRAQTPPASAAERASCSHSSADEVDNLKAVSALHRSRRPLSPADDLSIALYGNAVRLHLQRCDERFNGCRGRIDAHLTRLSIENDFHLPRVSAEPRSTAGMPARLPAEKTTHDALVERRHHRARIVNLAICSHEQLHRLYARISAVNGRDRTRLMRVLIGQVFNGVAQNLQRKASLRSS